MDEKKVPNCEKPEHKDIPLTAICAEKRCTSSSRLLCFYCWPEHAGHFVIHFDRFKKNPETLLEAFKIGDVKDSLANVDRPIDYEATFREKFIELDKKVADSLGAVRDDVLARIKTVDEDLRKSRESIEGMKTGIIDVEELRAKFEGDLPSFAKILEERLKRRVNTKEFSAAVKEFDGMRTVVDKALDEAFERTYERTTKEFNRLRDMIPGGGKYMLNDPELVERETPRKRGAATICSICERRDPTHYCIGPCRRAMHSECIRISSQGGDSLSLAAEDESIAMRSPVGSEFNPIEFTCNECRAGNGRCFSCKGRGVYHEKEKEKDKVPTRESSGKRARFDRFVEPDDDDDPVTAIGESDGGEPLLIKCNFRTCYRYYHITCVSEDFTRDDRKKGTFRCPAHRCHHCDDDRPPTLNCFRCPMAFHARCIRDEATEIVARLDKRTIVCSRHKPNIAPPSPSEKRKISFPAGGASGRRRVKEDDEPQINLVKPPAEPPKSNTEA